MAHAQIFITPYVGTDKKDFGDFELQLRGAIGVAGIADTQQPSFLRLHLRNDALVYYTTPEATKKI